MAKKVKDVKHGSYGTYGICSECGIYVGQTYAGETTHCPNCEVGLDFEEDKDVTNK